MKKLKTLLALLSPFGAVCFAEEAEDAPVEGFCGAVIGERGQLIVADIDASDYPPGLAVFPEGALHLYDITFFYTNLKDNVAVRTAAWAAHPVELPAAA